MAHRNLRTTSALLGLGLLAASGCAGQAAPAAEHSMPSRPPSETTASPEVASEPEAPAPLALARSLHEASMSEVVLDPRGEVALTLDTEGNVRLWTSLKADAQEPLALPVREPSWMSLARAEDGLVLAFIDTVGGGRVMHVELGDDGPRVTTAFEIPATEPVFELHVLDGGQRVVALGHDHRVSLYDRGGVERSAVDPIGFVPWQLRVQQVPGQAPAIVAVLVGPTRVQPLALEGDQLRPEGEPRAVEIDQGPNRNDLSLSPDGRTMVAMRRARMRGRRLTLELVDLPTNERRLLAVELDTRERPRVHVVDGERILLESSSGRGFWLDVAQAVPWDRGTTREETEDVPAVEVSGVALVESTEARRMHTTLVAGVRAVPTAHALVVDPIDDTRHLALGTTPLRPEQVAIDASGARVAWTTGSSIVLDDLGTGEPPWMVTTPHEMMVELAFVGADRLLTLGRDGLAVVVDADGQELSRAKMPVGWGLAEAGFRRGGDLGSGTLGLLPRRKSESLQVLDVGEGALGAVRGLERSRQTRFDQMETQLRDVRSVAESLGVGDMPVEALDVMVEDGRGGYLLTNRSVQPVLFWATEGGTRSIPLREGNVERLSPSPDGTQVAVVQRTSSGGLGEFRSAFERMVVSVIDLSTEQRTWTRVISGSVDLDWSRDGRRLGMASIEGGRVVDAQTGETLLERRDLGLKVVEVEDGDAAG